MDHEEYLKRRDELLKIRTDSHDSFDKAVLSLATGSLALSIAFLDKIGTPFNRLTFALIFATWAGFFLVILCNLLSYLFAKSNMDRKIQDLDDSYRKEIREGKAEEGVDRTFWQRRATDICNNAAFLTFAVSIVAFTCYIVAIQKHNFGELSKKQKEEQVMSMKKTAGVTEAKTPVAKQVITEGKTEIGRAIPSSARITPLGATEAPRAVSAPTGTNGGGSVIRGATEAPRAVAKPPSPPAAPAADAGKK
jgi:hypothetical protein